MNINDIVFGSPSIAGMMGSSAAGANQGDKPCINCQQPDTALPKEMPIGMLYVPYQSFRKLYDPQVGLERGTVFEELDKPFIGERVR